MKDENQLEASASRNHLIKGNDPKDIDSIHDIRKLSWKKDYSFIERRVLEDLQALFEDCYYYYYY